MSSPDDLTARSGGYIAAATCPFVLFTSKLAANEHLLTDDQIAAAVARHDAREIPLPPATFNCAVVSQAIWNMATPVV